ncbi:MAG: two-component regulator propeller domain-containing protein, partial [Bacteroidota bacterium]
MDQSTPIFNIHVDENNKKWVSNTKKDIYLLHALDLADKIDRAGGKQYLFDLPGGNGDISWTKSAMDNLINGAEILSAFYDKRNKDLWIGTIDQGVYRMKVEPSLKVVERLNNGNSKLKSNRINVVFKDYKDRIWLGTDEGAYIGKDGKWKLVEKYYNIEAITGYGNSTWAMGDESVWEIDSRDNWLLLDIDVRRDIEGPMRDIALDHDGNLWIASNVMTRYNINTEAYTVFGPGQYITSQYVNCIAVDGDGTLWIGSEDKGMYHIERADNIVVTALVEKGLSCEGLEDDASLIVKVTGGEPPFSYNWEQDIEGDNPKNLAGGTYRITVTDDNGKSNSTSVEIPDPKMELSINLESEESGIGKKDGVASIKIEGGLPEYTIKWDNGEYGRKAKKLGGGTHTVVVVDASGCEAKAAFAVGQKTEDIEIAIEVTEKLKCYDDSNAAIEAIVNGGRPPYTFNWKDIESKSEKLSNLSAGAYELEVIDSDGKKGIGSINLIQPQKLIVSTKILKAASTNNEDGQATAEATGGKGDLKYLWDNGETTATANKLTPGKHTVTVTDNVGCSTESIVEISENIEVISVEVKQTKPVDCYGGKTAALKAEVSGGKPPFTYEWSDPSLKGDVIENVGAGRYNLTVRDAAGTEASYSVGIAQPDEITAEIKILKPSDADQENGEAEVKVKGAKGGLTYKWGSGETLAKAKALAPGSQTVTVTTEDGCEIIASTEIEADYGEVTAAIKKVSEISCPGEKDGHIQIEVNGGKGPYEYKWSDATIVGGNPSNIGAGKYEVTITDDLGSTTTAKLSFEDPPALSGTIEVIQAASTGNEDGKAEVKVKGGTGKNYFKWDNGASNAIAENLAPGVRSVIVSDENECTLELEVEIEENVLDLALNFEAINSLDCAGDDNGQAVLSVNGGKGPYNIEWSANVNGSPSLNDGKVELTQLKAGTYSVNIKDAAGNMGNASIEINDPEPLTADPRSIKPANSNQEDGVAEVKVGGGKSPYTYKWDNGESKAKAEKLAAGEHTVEITDANGCKISATVQVTEDILPLQVSIGLAETLKCAGDNSAALLAEVNGGKEPYSYTWSKDANGSAEVTSLAAGNYSVTVVDAANQEVKADFIINAPEALKAEAIVTDPASVGNNDGKAEVRVSGGTGKYTYKWDNGETKVKANELGEGKHTVEVTDENGCLAVAAFEVSENILPLQVSIELINPVQCADDESATIEALVNGGKAPYTYKWSDSSSDKKELGSLSAGSYTVTIVDAANQEATAEIRIQAPEALSAIAKATAMASVGNEDGVAEVEVAGGTGKYTYAWDNGSTKKDAKDLSPGNHTVIVKDENNCTVEASVEIAENVLALNAS